MRREIQFLADSGFINNLELWSLKSGDDLVKKLTVTPTGWEYLKLKEKAAWKPLFSGMP